MKDNIDKVIEDIKYVFDKLEDVENKYGVGKLSKQN